MYEVEGYCPEFGEPRKVIINFSTNSFKGKRIVSGYRCENQYNCNYIRQYNTKCPLYEEHIDDIID